MQRSTWFFAAGAVATVTGFARTIEPLIELGIALVVMGLITNPKPKP